MNKEKKTRFTIAFTLDERRKLMILASSEGLCVSDYIKKLLAPLLEKLKGI